VQLDHVLIGVADLDAAADDMAAVHGLAVAGGGRHPGWGTANRIVPLGDCYLELVSVVDADEAASSDFGRWVAAMQTDGPRMGWVVRSDDLVADAERLHLGVGDGSRRTAGGDLLRWQLAGIPEAADQPWLPFFIQWASDTAHPGAAHVEHPAGLATLRELHVAGDEALLRDWLGGTLPAAVHVTPGTAGPTAVVIATDGGDVLIRSDAPPGARSSGR
jgi:hypothetical protein